MRNLMKNRTAFTMLELVFVIVVLGILAALAIPRFDRDLKQEAADNILSDIRYTQHLALIDYKHRFGKPKWQSAFWRIGFGFCSGSTDYYEYIGSDMSYAGGISNIEAAVDPTNSKRMLWSGLKTCTNGGDSDTSDRIFITHKFGITSVTFNGSGNNNCSNAKYIGFDHLGRPHQGFANTTSSAGSSQPNYSSYLDASCTITFTMSDNDTFAITIEPETGYAFIVGQPSS